jgi:hypothetical protein
MTQVAILGAGPAGMMAAHAVARNGHEPVLFAEYRLPSHVNHDMFILKPFPGVGSPHSSVWYDKIGRPEGYAEKCYGNEDAPTSWERIGSGSGSIWWLSEVYDSLWSMYHVQVMAKLITDDVIEDIKDDYPLVISTLPATAICRDLEGHLFGAVDTWLARDESDYQLTRQRVDNYLAYNGSLEPGWYRYSSLRGIRTWEYASDPLLVYPREIGEGTPILTGKKFTDNTCSCHPGVHRVGRWAQWKRGVLNHHPYEQTTAILASLKLGKGA